ncbi:ankyrin repeat domain-containing protein [Fusarium phyllophilum]|uniref:Ankyrin repeat domain-containing protein n=1 Tax=Fusarium phyllophilum TaxID=47803 RepID=A0A8H5MV24_9HYPO|nr:ankyrin repeat domain-containing protein [Fusarium phyllophilum]
MERFRKDGPSLIHATSRLWGIFLEAVGDPAAGSVTVVLDALDECAETELIDLIRNVESQFDGNKSEPGKLKYVMTCRPYYQVLSRFRGLLAACPSIHIPGKEESEAISKEVNYVIKHRVSQLSLNDKLKQYVEERLQEIPHRTYLWVYLVFDYLENEVLKKTLKVIKSKIATLPKSVNEACEHILNKTKDDQMVRKVLSIIMVASRPLTPTEMNVAVNVDFDARSIEDLDLEDIDEFEKSLRFRCGLFVSIFKGRIYLLHQTAREFLLADLSPPTIILSQKLWHRSITTQYAHAVLAEACVLFLNLFESYNGRMKSYKKPPIDADNETAFTLYAATSWGSHFRQADFQDDARIIPFALHLCDQTSKAYSFWTRLVKLDDGEFNHRSRNSLLGFTDLMIASHYGLGNFAKTFLDQGSEIEGVSRSYGVCSPLSLAIEGGHESVVELLLNAGADPSADTGDLLVPLLMTTGPKDESIMNMLLDAGADINATGYPYGESALLQAADAGWDNVIKLLLDRGADPLQQNSKVRDIPLERAVTKGHALCVKLLLEKMEEIDTQAEYNQRRKETYRLAITCKQQDVVNMLIGIGIKMET